MGTRNSMRAFVMMGIFSGVLFARRNRASSRRHSSNKRNSSNNSKLNQLSRPRK